MKFSKILIVALVFGSFFCLGQQAPVSSSTRSSVSAVQQNSAALTQRPTLNFLEANGICSDDSGNNSTDCWLYPDYLIDGTTNQSLGTVLNQAISSSKFAGFVKDKMVGETWATNPMPDNAYFKVLLDAGNASSPSVQTSVPIVLRGGNWITGNGRKGANTSAEWIGTRIIPSNSFPDAITPPASAATNFSCAGSSGSFAAGSYLVSGVFLTNLQTYTGTSTVVPGMTNAGTEAIVTCPASGTISFPAFNTNSATTFGTISALQGFWAPTVNGTTTYSGTVGSTCAAAPGSCNVPIVVSALTNANWARNFAIAKLGTDCTSGGVGCVVIDVGAAQEYQKIVAIDQINNKLVLAGPMLHTHTNPYPIAPSYSETLQNTNSGGTIGTNVACAGTNVGNNAFGQMFACRPTSGSAVATTLTMTSGAVNTNMPMPRINFTAPLIVGGSTGPMGTPEFDARLQDLQVSCRRPNGTVVIGGLGAGNFDIQEHGFSKNLFIRDCPNGLFVFGNQAQNSSYNMTEVNDGCASAASGNGCSGGSASITNNNYRILVQNVQPGPLSFNGISSSSANCLITGCNYTQFIGSVFTVDRTETASIGVHGEADINVISIENQASLTALNPTGGSSNNATGICSFRLASDARTSGSFNQMASGAIESVCDDIFAGKPITTSTTITGGSGGTTSIVVSDASGLHCNQEFLLDTVASGVQEYVRTADFTASGSTLPAKSQCISGTTVTLASPPANSHSGTIPIVPQDTAFNEGTFVPTGEYLVSNPCSGCVNTNRDRYTTYNGVPTIQNGAALFSSDAAATVPVVIQPGPNVTQTADLFDLYTDNLGTVLGIQVKADGTLVNKTHPIGGATLDSGSGTAYVVTGGQITSLETSGTECFVPANPNSSTTPTVAFNGLAAKTIVKVTGAALALNDMVTTQPACLSYNGSTMYLLNPQTVTGSGKAVLQNNPTFPQGFSAGGTASGVNTVRLTADSSGITGTTPGTTFLTLPTLLANTNYSFSCELLYSQATAVVADGFSVQAATNAATRWDAWGTMNVSNPASTTLTGSQGSALNVTTTTSTPVVTATPGAIATVYQARLAGTIQVGASVPTVNIAAFTGNASDAVTIKAGSFCSVHI
jgi:hypothetical protein